MIHQHKVVYVVISCNVISIYIGLVSGLKANRARTLSFFLSLALCSLYLPAYQISSLFDCRQDLRSSSFYLARLVDSFASRQCSRFSLPMGGISLRANPRHSERRMVAVCAALVRAARQRKLIQAFEMNGLCDAV